MKRNRDEITRGPRQCWRTGNASAPCTICGAYSDPVHVPLDHSGFYCAKHCPNCELLAIDYERVALVGDRAE
jgi:hypothetical protein